MKLMEELIRKSEEKGFARRNNYEINFQEGKFFRLNHNGKTILNIDFTKEKQDEKINVFGQTASDKKAIQTCLKHFRLNTYANNLEGFKEWCKDHPNVWIDLSTFDTDIHKQYFDLDREQFVERVEGNDMHANGTYSRVVSVYSFAYNEETKRFSPDEQLQFDTKAYQNN